MPLGAAIRLLRPKQWAKNLLVFAALIFTRKFVETETVITAFEAFFSLCLVSSAVYVVNDILDVEKDRAHPVKKKRPLASGEISVGAGWVIAALCLLLGFGLGFLLRPIFVAGLGGYIILQVAYNLFAKKTPILDVFTVAFGFVLRAALGAMAIRVEISAWLLFCTGALALLLGFAKRRHEFMLDNHDRSTTRPALADYTLPLLDNMVMFSAALAGLSYGVYAIMSPTAQQYPSLFLTTPFVLYGIARAMFLIFAKGDGGEPENIVLGDPHMIWTILLFIAAAIYAMSLGQAVPYIQPH